MSDGDAACGGGFSAQQPVYPPNLSEVPQQLQLALQRAACQPGQIVFLRQHCFSANQVFPPGLYRAVDLPDTAFAMGMVLPPQTPVVAPQRREERIEWVQPPDAESDPIG